MAKSKEKKLAKTGSRHPKSSVDMKDLEAQSPHKFKNK